MGKTNDSPLEARIRVRFQERLERLPPEFMLTASDLNEAVRGARIQEMPEGVYLQVTMVSFGLDLMNRVDVELEAARRDVEAQDRVTAKNSQ
jgi:hypothetical protein